MEAFGGSGRSRSAPFHTERPFIRRMVEEYKIASKSPFPRYQRSLLILRSFLTLRTIERRPFLDSLLALHPDIFEIVRNAEGGFKLLVPTVHNLRGEIFDSRP